MNKIIHIVFCFISIFAEINGQFFGTDPVRFDVDPIENCDNNSLWTWYLNLETYNNSHLIININGTLDRDFDNSISVLLEFFQWTSRNEWKRVIRLAKNQACNFVRTIAGDSFGRLLKEVGVVNPKCPIPKSFYHLDNRYANVQKTIFGKFLIGRFKGIARGYTSKKQTIFCGQGSFTTTKI